MVNVSDRPPPIFRLLQKEDAARNDVQSFRCGDEPHAEKVAAYLRSGEAWAEQREKRNKTYLYEIPIGDGGLIGYSTLGKKKITLTDQVPEGDRSPTVLICWFAIGEAHQGRQDGVSHAENLLGEVARIALDQGVAGLSAFIDDQNERALRFWQRMGFRRLETVESFVDDDGSMNHFYVLLFPQDLAA